MRSQFPRAQFNGTSFNSAGPVSDWGYGDRRWMVDFNGDGKADLCRAVGNNNGNLLACSLSTGSGLTGDYFIPVGDWGYDVRRWMGDVNGDNNANLCRAVGNKEEYLGCSLSTGTGLAGEYDILLPVSDWSGWDQRWFVDGDGDHRADFAHGNSYMGNLLEYVGYRQ